MIAAITAAALSLCVDGAALLPLDDGRFILEWRHSVEHVIWRETWQVTDAGDLALSGAAVKGSGAGMEPGPDAVLVDGWWRWRIDPPRIMAQLVLGASGATGSGWHICQPDQNGICAEIGARPHAPLILRACDRDGWLGVTQPD